MPAVFPPEPRSTGGSTTSADGEQGFASKVNSWRSVTPGGVLGGMPGWQSEGVAVEPSERSCLVNLSVPDAKHPTVCPVKGIPGTGAGLTTMTANVASKLQGTFPDVNIVRAMDQPHQLKVADACVLNVTRKMCPVSLMIRTAWGPLVLDPLSFAVIPGNDDVMIIGNPTLKMLGIEVNDSFGEHARVGCETNIKGIESPRYFESRRVAVSMDTMKQRDNENGRALGSTWF